MSFLDELLKIKEKKMKNKKYKKHYHGKNYNPKFKKVKKSITGEK